MEDKKTPRRLVLLIDYRRQFYSSTRSRGACMDVEKLGRVFEADGYVVEVIQFADIDFRARSFAGNVVLYQSAEDPGLRYKQYIEDLLLGLRFQGAYLVPSFEAFRAHHNKVFMEILRDLTCVNEIRTVRSRSFGTLQELRARADAIRYPATVKPCQGSKGQNISIVGSREELLHAAARVSRSLTWDNLQFYIYHLWDGNGFLPMSNHRERFVVQDTIPSLAGDYKVLAYWDRFFVLYRRNRHGVPIASGSKRFDYITIVPDKVLDLATLVLRSFASPYGSFDIALSNGVPHLLEFQFVCFGQRALESSTGYFHQVQGRWVRVEATSTLEEEFARAVNCYIHERAGAD